MTDPENYLNPPEAAKSERGGSLSEMGPKLRATMERLHREAAMRNANQRTRYALATVEAIERNQV